MAKTCPSCGYRPIGPFTDNCPICAEPVRNVRSGGGGFPRPSSTLQWILVAVLAAVVAVAGCCGIGMWRLGTAVRDAREDMERAQVEMEARRKARTVVVTAADLLREFQADPVAADQKYAGKYLEISGVSERGGQGRHDSPFIIMHGGDETAKIKIECFFYPADDQEEARIKRMGKGQPITVRGEYDGRVSNVQLRDCEWVR